MGRLSGLIAFALVLALAGCAGSRSQATTSAPAVRAAAGEATPATSLSASDAALLESLEESTNPGPLLLSQVLERQEQLEGELGAAPFVAETTVKLPGAEDAVSVSLPRAPDGRAPRPDRFEPDGTQSKARVLHRGETQTRTIAGAHDEDWIALPNNEGRGFYYIIASGEFTLETKRLRGQKKLESVGGWAESCYYGCTPAGDYVGLGRYSWLKVSASNGPVSYVIMHLPSAPESMIATDGRFVATFAGSVFGLDPTAYLIRTGRHATRQQIKGVRDALFGVGVAGSCLDRVEDIPNQNPLLQRSYVWPEGSRQANAIWTRSEAVGGRARIVSAGRDGTCSDPEYAAKRDVYLRLKTRASTSFLGGKPAIYLYPSREQSVTVRLDYGGRLTTTAPVIRSADHSWAVMARPDGTLTDAAGRRWPYLFWEGLGLPCFDLSTGSVIRGVDVDMFLRTALAERGLSAAESAAFREYWVPKLSASPWVLIHFEGAAYEACAPLSVTPRPDTSLRVFMVAKPLERPVRVRPQLPPTPPKRRGFTLVEWGGTLLANHGGL